MLNFTPLKAFIDLKDRNVAAQQRSGEAMGSIAGFVGKMISDSRYEQKKKDFFNSLGDGEIRAIKAQIEEIDKAIAEKKREIATLGGGI